jgi:hypothetical protein
VRQFLTARSIVGAAIRQLKYMTEQAQLGVSKLARRSVSRRSLLRRFLAASPQFQVAVWPNWLIAIWYGEELMQ